MGNPTAAQKRMYAKMGVAMPDGSYYIRDAADLNNAILAVGRGNADHDSIRAHIMKRAKALHLDSKIPDNWSPDGSLKHSAVEAGQAFIEHFGVKGMKWGVRRDRAPASGDSAEASRLLAKAHAGGGIHTLSNDELTRLNTRLNLETNHQRLTTTDRNSGGEAVKKILVNAGKQEAQKYASKYAAKGGEWLVKEGTRQLLGTSAGLGRHA